jgi:hypothetical protein
MRLKNDSSSIASSDANHGGVRFLSSVPRVVFGVFSRIGNRAGVGGEVC